MPAKAGSYLSGREICTREDYEESFNRRSWAKKALAFLDRYEIFPLTYRNHKLVYLNVLGLHVYFSGCLTAVHGESESAKMYDAVIAGGRAQQRDLSDICHAELGLTLRKSSLNLEFGRNGSIYARLLSLMGFHTSSGARDSIERKAFVGSELPRYLSDLIRDYTSLPPENQERCRKYLRDLVSVCFDTKASVRTVNGRSEEVRIDLLTQPTPDLVERQGRQIIKAVNCVYPAVSLSHDDFRLQRITFKKASRKKTKYFGFIRIPLEKALKFPQRTGTSASSIEIQMMLRPSRYSFDSPQCMPKR